MRKIRRALANPRKAIYVLIHHLGTLFGHLGHREYARFVVLTRSRTGSTMLTSFLNSHPNIYAMGEVFSWLNGKRYENVLNKVFSRQPANVKAVGFKIFYYHPQDDPSCGIWNELMNMRELRLIHLKRRNILRTLLSRKIAAKRDIWSATNGVARVDVDAKKVEFKVDELREEFERTRAWEEEYDKMFSTHPIVVVYYEDLVERPEMAFRWITDMLGLPHHKPKTALVKQNPEKLSQLIVNYEEVKQAFSGTQWESYFED